MNWLLMMIHCGWNTMRHLAQGKTAVEAAEIASHYGYELGHTQWGRQIGINDPDLDRTVQVVCPDCGAEQWGKG